MAERDMIFISSHTNDHKWVELLKIHLKPALHGSKLKMWQWPALQSHEAWPEDIREAIAGSKIAIMLVSPDYLGSDFILSTEIPWMLANARKGLNLFWIPIRPSNWEAFKPLHRIQCASDPEKPLSSLLRSERDDAFVAIARRVILNGNGVRSEDRTLLISRVTLQNIRNIRRLELNLEEETPALRTLILGDNAAGKTTLLRAIALGLCDASSANALFKRIPGNFISYAARHGNIYIDLRAPDGSIKTIHSAVVRTSSGSEVIEKVEGKGNFPWRDLFVCGYGAHRARAADTGYSGYKLDAALMTLFDYDASLQNPELVLLRQPASIKRDLERKLLSVLMLDPQTNRLEYTQEGIFLQHGETKQPLVALSDGYRSTTQWVLDLLGWLIYADKMQDPEQLSGIVLLDELEQHLHPRWQRQVLTRLKQQFPKMQFIATTHSPLVAASVDPQAGDKLFHLDRDEKQHVVASEIKNFRGLSVDQLLASEAFDYLVQADPRVEAMLAEASRLASKGGKRTDEEEERYGAIREKLNEIIVPDGDTLIEREVRSDFHSRMRERIKELELAVFGETR